MGRYLVELAMRAKHKLLVMQVCDECYTKNHLSVTIALLKHYRKKGVEIIEGHIMP